LAHGLAPHQSRHPSRHVRPRCPVSAHRDQFGHRSP